MPTDPLSPLDPWSLATLTVYDFAGVADIVRMAATPDARWVLYDYLLMWLDRLRSTVEGQHERELAAERQQSTAQQERLAQQAREVSVMLSDAGIGAMPIPEGVRALVMQLSEAKAAAHELRLIDASVGERGKTDCSTPTFIRVQNIIERMEHAEAQSERLEDQLGTMEGIAALRESRALKAEADVASLIQQLAGERRHNAELNGWKNDCERERMRLTQQLATLQSALDQQLKISGDYWQVIETQRQELIRLREKLEAP